MNVLELLQGQMSDNVLDSLMSQVGADDRDKTKAAANGVMATLMGALSKNTATSEGRESLANALEKDHDGSALEDIMGVLAGSSSQTNNRAMNGSGILNHILGSKQDTASNMISKMSGLDQSSVTSMMMKMAPVVMGALGKQKRQNSLDADGIAGLLSDTVQSSRQSQAEMSIIEKFLDQDGDGSVMDDLLRMGGDALGSFFKK